MDNSNPVRLSPLLSPCMLGEGDEDRSTEQEITPSHLATESVQAELRRTGPIAATSI
jgi:hypothetical protein